MSRPHIVLSEFKSDLDRKLPPPVSKHEEWFAEASENSGMKVHHRRSSRDILVRLYSIWQPQNSESYRPSAVEKFRAKAVRTTEHPRNNKGAKRDGKESRNGRELSRSKLRIVESVVETINHLQKSKSIRQRALSDSTSPSSSVITSKAREQFKKSIQQTIDTSQVGT